MLNRQVLRSPRPPQPRRSHSLRTDARCSSTGGCEIPVGNSRVCAALSISRHPAPTDEPISCRARWWWRDRPTSLPSSAAKHTTVYSGTLRTHHAFAKEAPAAEPTPQAGDEAAPAGGSRCRTRHQHQLFRPGKGPGSKRPSHIKVSPPQTRKLRAAAQATFSPLLSFFLGLNWTFPQALWHDATGRSLSTLFNPAAGNRINSSQENLSAREEQMFRR